MAWTSVIGVGMGDLNFPINNANDKPQGAYRITKLKSQPLLLCVSVRFHIQLQLARDKCEHAPTQQITGEPKKNAFVVTAKHKFNDVIILSGQMSSVQLIYLLFAGYLFWIIQLANANSSIRAASFCCWAFCVFYTNETVSAQRHKMQAMLARLENMEARKKMRITNEAHIQKTPDFFPSLFVSSRVATN